MPPISPTSLLLHSIFNFFESLLSTEFDVRMQEIAFPGDLDSKIFWGSMPSDPPKGRDIMAAEVLQPPTSVLLKALQVEDQVRDHHFDLQIVKQFFKL